jgi:hypothetical protein
LEGEDVKLLMLLIRRTRNVLACVFRVLERWASSIVYALEVCETCGENKMYGKTCWEKGVQRLRDFPPITSLTVDGKKIL